MFITGDTTVSLHLMDYISIEIYYIEQLILNERGRFGRHKTTKLFEPNGGLIHTLRWKESLIAFANDKGVGIFDLRASKLVGFEETTGEKE